MEQSGSMCLSISIAPASDTRNPAYHAEEINKRKEKDHRRNRAFPVIDGIYFVSEHFNALAFFISDVFRSMAAEFLVLENWERSVIRDAVAYGPVIMGGECKEGAAILKESDYANSILLGNAASPCVHSAESYAESSGRGKLDGVSLRLLNRFVASDEAGA
jgi:hypothetical protein